MSVVETSHPETGPLIVSRRRTAPRPAASAETRDDVRWIAWAIGAALALLPLAPRLLSGWVLVDWTGAAQMGAVGWLEGAVVLGWAAAGRPVPAVRSRRLLGLIGLWISAMVAATVASDDPALALVRTAEWLGHVAFAAVVWAEVRRHTGVARAVEAGAIVGLVAVVGAVLWTWATDTARAHDWMYDAPLVGGVRWLSVYGMVGVTFGARAWLGDDASARERTWALAAMTLGWMMLWWGASRGAFVAIGATGGLLLVGATGRRVPVAAVLAATALAGAVLTLPFPVGNAVTNLLRMLGSQIPEGTGMDGFTSGRTVLWGMVVEAWRARPWLGLGPGATVALLTPVGNGHAHNAVLQALAEWGVLGAVPFVALALGVLGIVGRQAVGGAPPAVRAAGAFVVAVAVASLLDGLTSDPATTALLAAAVALALAGRTPAAAPPLAPRASALVRRGLAAVAVLVVVVMTVHLAVLRALWAPGVPSPDSARVRLVTALPTHPHLKEVEGWGRAWMRTQPGDAERLAAWGLTTGRSPWLFLRLRGDLAAARGDLAAARADQRHAARLYARATQPLDNYRRRVTVR